jgi:hypothetical protein
LATDNWQLATALTAGALRTLRGGFFILFLSVLARGWFFARNAYGATRPTIPATGNWQLTTGIWQPATACVCVGLWLNFFYFFFVFSCLRGSILVFSISCFRVLRLAP